MIISTVVYAGWCMMFFYCYSNVEVANIEITNTNYSWSDHM